MYTNFTLVTLVISKAYLQTFVVNLTCKTLYIKASVLSIDSSVKLLKTTKKQSIGLFLKVFFQVIKDGHSFHRRQIHDINFL